MNRVRAALVACGKVGLTHAQALAALDTVEFVAVCDRTIEGATVFAREFGVAPYDDERQVEEFVAAILEDRAPAVDGAEGRKVVELFTALYRSQRDHRPVRFPLAPEVDRDDMDGRLDPR